tara:strand:+ start:352 stop:1401 length:1050 start_codon:yes stop_codon:yes gene_type:complete
MTCLIHTPELDDISLRFLQTGSCELEKHTQHVPENNIYNPLIDGCNSCGSSCDYVVENNLDGSVCCTNCGMTLRYFIRVDGVNNYKDDQGIGTDRNHHHLSKDSSNPFDTGAIPVYPKGYKQEFICKDGTKRLYDMSRLNVRYISHKQKDFWKVSCMFKKACVTLGNSAPLSNAKEIWTVIAKSDKVCRGANRRGLIGNSLLFACYRTKIGITQDTVADALFIPSTEITKGRKIFKEIMITENREDILSSDTHEESQFNRLASSIGVPRTHWILVKHSQEMYEKYKHELSTLAPASGIAGVLYHNIIKAGLKVTKSQIKETCDICTPTLNKALKIISKVIERDEKKTPQ